MPRDNVLTRSRKKQAATLLRSNQLNEARALYEKICQTDHSDAEAWFALGMIHQRLGRPADAATCYAKVISLRPDHVTALWHLGNAFRNQKQYQEAASAYRRVLAIQPGHLQALGDLGTLLEEQRSFEAAVNCYVQGLQHYPDNADLHYNLANALRECGRIDEASAHFRDAIELRPDFAEAYCNLGVMVNTRGNRAEAIGLFQQALRVRPHHLEALNNLGYAFFHDGQFKEAISYFRRVLEINPRQIDACLSLAEALIHDGCLSEAVVYCQQVIGHQSGNPLAHNLLGIALSRQAKLQEAIHYYTQALARQPDSADFHNNLGLALQHQGRMHEALARYRRALDIKPDYSQAHSNLLFALNYTSMDPARLFAEHRHFGEVHKQTAENTVFTNSPDPDRRLRIGYVSPDFRTHSVSYFIEPILAHHDIRQVEVYCYSQTQQTDDTTKRMKNYVQHWREIQGRSDAEVADMIHADGVDILVDLAGHTGHNRLLAFVRRPAPIQVTYLGYPNTTGLAQMDYRITDALADPSGQEAFHTEKLARLPAGFLCYRPMEDAPAVTPPPVLQSGSITFGSFNAMEKISPQVLAQWANILKVLPGSSLILKNKSLKDAMTCRLVLERFQEHGIAPQRLELLEWSRSQIDHLAVYHRVDIALDTFPYNGTTTTCEALWMGVPVISLEGTRHAGRVGVSLLTQIGHADLVAGTPEDYLHVAVDLAGDRDRLVTLRADLRDRMANSPLCNAKIITQNLESTYREMWRTWCAEQKSSVNQPDSP